MNCVAFGVIISNPRTMRENHSSIIEMMTRIVIDRGMMRNAINVVKVRVINIWPIIAVVVSMRKVSTMTARTHVAVVVMTISRVVNMVSMNPSVDMVLLSGRWWRVTVIPSVNMR
jgi:hypothetical protein